MGSQRSLDAYAGGTDDAPDEGADATGVYRWHPDGIPCDRCGVESTRLWRSGTRVVCPGCKEW